jgi:hypothetical protein
MLFVLDMKLHLESLKQVVWEMSVSKISPQRATKLLQLGPYKTTVVDTLKELICWQGYVCIIDLLSL